MSKSPTVRSNGSSGAGPPGSPTTGLIGRLRLGRWIAPLLWGTLPILAGPALANALDPTDRTFQVAVSAGLWSVWSITMVASLVPRPATLTLLRTVAPGALAATAWAAVATPEPGLADGVALAAASACTAAAMWAGVGQTFVDGASYGDELRLPLRPPGWLLLGPLEVVWLLAVVGATVGPLLLAAGNVVLGLSATVVGLPLAAVALRALHGLTSRCVVFVPAGLVVVDPSGLDEPLPAYRAAVERIRPAPAETSATDLTSGALGLAVQIDFSEPQRIHRRARGAGQRSKVEADSVIISPTRPGALLEAARRRGLPVG